jgi:NAD(P) transhydrogenase subunit alpha
MIVATVKETFPGEKRVALVPALVPVLTKAGLEVIVQTGAGLAAGFPDDAYVQRGARIVEARADAFTADCVLQVRSLGANLEAGLTDLEWMRPQQVVIGLFDPLSQPQAARQAAARGVTQFAMEMIPRITRAQGMDVLSSMATVAGYRAVLLGALALPKMFPMMMTAAGTIAPAKVLILGAGVAGLQAIASARKLGAVVTGYDVRPAVKEQVESLGAKFLQLELETAEAEGAGGYAKQQSEEFIRRQQEMMLTAVAEQDVVITTAAVPGRKAPVLVTAEMVRAMAPGSVIVDLAAERGGNCELTAPGQTVVKHGVSILGPTNLPADVPHDASQMYAKNITTFLLNMVKDGRWKPDADEDEITRETMITRGGQVVHPRMVELLGSPSGAGEAD